MTEPENPPEGETAAGSPRDSTRRAALPWLAVAMVLAAIALVLAYLTWFRPPQE